MNPKIYVIGVGMGNPDTLTVAAQRAIEEAPVLVGAPRLLGSFPGKARYPYIAPDDIIGCIREQGEGPVAILLSGDVGFYSGAKNLWSALREFDVEVIPGISSLVYFCAQLRTPWEDVRLVSAHGRTHNAAGEIQCHEKTFVLTGGKARAEDVCKELVEWGLGGVKVSVGENLSYQEERIVVGTAKELSKGSFADLAVLLVENDRAVDRGLSNPGIPDSAFLRGEVPMTKEEVRVISMAKLGLSPHHTLWDVGAGTGSISIEGALSLPTGRVYAIEKKREALSLLRQNKERFGVPNLMIISGSAPEALLDLPKPDRVFLGGTSGNLAEILKVAFEKNPATRVVVNAITLETLNEAVRCFDELGLGDVDVLQVAVTRTKRTGRYHMLDAQTPVWVISGEGKS